MVLYVAVKAILKTILFICKYKELYKGRFVISKDKEIDLNPIFAPFIQGIKLD